MGSRRQPRPSFSLSVSICGTDRQGRAFIERVLTQNISREGAALEGARCDVNPGDSVVLRNGQNTGRFRVVWVQEAECGQLKKLGLSRLATPGLVEDSELPAASPDDFQRPRLQARRRHPRFRHELATELRLKDVKIPMWATTENLSEGGCTVQTPLRVPVSTELVIGIWMGTRRIWAQGTVVNSEYGHGTGIRFKDMSLDGRTQLTEFLSQNSDAAVSDRRETPDGYEKTTIDLGFLQELQPK
jgi:PilZ domain-containing protein